ncbi:MAG: DUF4038 domain-containing protein [Gammaproteobacteria bacterium]
MVKALQLRPFLLVALLAIGGVIQAQGEASPESSRFPLHIDGTRLIDSTGHDFRIVGDAPWTLIVALTLDEADRYLAARKAEGFNTILVELIEPKFSGPRNRDGDFPFPESRPFESPSPQYFAHARAVLDLALHYDFLVLLAPAYVGWECGSEGWCQQMLRTPDATLRRYGKYVGTLLAAYPNLIWVHGGDVDAAHYGAMAKVEAVYQGINAVLPGALHTAHCSRNLSAVDCYDRPWLNVNSTYSDCELTPAKIRLDRRRVPARPSIYIEGRYEEEDSTGLCLRSQLWWSMLGGSVGHVFGNKRIWRFEPDWQDAMDTPASRAMTVASTLLARLQRTDQHPVATDLAASKVRVERMPTMWDRLTDAAYWPSQAPRLALAAAEGSDLEVPVAESTSTTGGTTLAYLPYRSTIRYLGSNKTICWINPRSGGVQAADPGSPLESPDDQDWLFVAESAVNLCAATR